MIPKGSRDLLVAGRCLSSRDRAGELRIARAGGLYGDRPGGRVAAALAAKLGVTPGEVPMAELKALLTQRGHCARMTGGRAKRRGRP